jgi:hypothetical protein
MSTVSRFIDENVHSRRICAQIDTLPVIPERLGWLQQSCRNQPTPSFRATWPRRWVPLSS